ncbi:hypothetical protein [Ruminococcus sp.]|uniref:hypothetical protein n=1 Tax=Ruminococcus sp. TaxID=41978 RepID=UPI001B3FD031|nr:hypothetical protein [Ruminococcus sp.]MBP5431189.1 hypothetical protein [Ruminococcus sp.]
MSDKTFQHEDGLVTYPRWEQCIFLCKHEMICFTDIQKNNALGQAKGVAGFGHRLLSTDAFGRRIQQSAYNAEKYSQKVKRMK